jgi:hypothetical protein
MEDGMGLELDNGRKQRWIVLLPESLTEDQELTHKIYWKAMWEKIAVFFLILVDDPERCLQVRRRMATIAAQISDDVTKVEWDTVDSDHYIQELRRIVRSGDIVVCQKEQRVRSGLFKSEPIGEYIQDREKIQVITLSGFYSEKRKKNKARIKGLLSLFWALSILIFFSFLEIQMDLALTGVGRKMMLMLLIIFEAGAFYAWNSLQLH